LKKKKNLVAFLKGLSYKTREDDIREFFKDLTIEQVVLVKDQLGKPKGLAYVEF
jgi:RNA recognition motif-containing protein